MPAAGWGTSTVHDSGVPAFQPDLKRIQDNLAQAAFEVAPPYMIPILLIPADCTRGHQVEVGVVEFCCRPDFYPMIADTDGFLHDICSYAAVTSPRRSLIFNLL